MKAPLVVRTILVLSFLAVSVWFLQKDDDLDFDRRYATALGLVRFGLALGAVLGVQGWPDSRWSRYLQMVGFTLLSWIPCYLLVLYGLSYGAFVLPFGKTWSWSEFFRACEVVSFFVALCLSIFLVGWALPRLERTVATRDGAGPAGPGRRQPPTQRDPL